MQQIRLRAIISWRSGSLRSICQYNINFTCLVNFTNHANNAHEKPNSSFSKNAKVPLRHVGYRPAVIHRLKLLGRCRNQCKWPIRQWKQPVTISSVGKELCGSIFKRKHGKGERYTGVFFYSQLSFSSLNVYAFEINR